MRLNIGDFPLDCGMGGNPRRFLRVSRKKKFHAKIAPVSGFKAHRLLPSVSGCPEGSGSKLTFIAERPPPPHIAYQEVLVVAEALAEYFS